MKKIIPVFLMALVLSCQPAKENATESQQSQSFEKERREFQSQMKSAPEAAAQIQATAADFNLSLTNNAAEYMSYTGDSLKAAANLGVYLADLNYCVAYQQGASTKELFTAAHGLSKAIGIDQNILDFLIKRYNENIDQNDSVKTIIGELYWNSTDGLQDASKERLLGVAMAAFQIETLHLALGVIATYPKDILPDDSRIQILVPLFKMVLEQQQRIETIHAFLLTIGNEKNENFAYYDAAFKDLIDVYKRLNVNDAIANNQGSALLNDAVVNELNDKVNTIRDKIISLG